jgi:Heme/copper-type cytochrome/quinol oxidases, subunit 2
MTRQPSNTKTTASARPRRRPYRSAPRGDRRLRLAIFGVIALAVGSLAIGLVVSRVMGPPASDASAVGVKISMEGYSPAMISAKVGTEVKVDLINPDSSMHSDGGGIHSFHIDALNVHQTVQPLSDLVFGITAMQPGTYDFYCDTCCGGKENPAMHGTLTVTA